MNLFRKPEVKTLAEWLEIATRRLAIPAQKRIKVEIESHYAESVEAHIRNGFSDCDAQNAALAELGEANASARRLRKRHLTQSEASMIMSASKARRNKFSLVVSYLGFAVFVLEAWTGAKDQPSRCAFPSIFTAVDFVVMIALPTICFMLSDRTRKKMHLRSAVLVMSISGFSAGLVVKVLFVQPLGSRLLVTLLCLILLVHALKAFLLWWKMGTIGPIRGEIPPLDATPSQ